jgi:hypothetical protein
MFFEKGRGALWVCIWNQRGGGLKRFGNRWFEQMSLKRQAVLPLTVTVTVTVA